MRALSLLVAAALLGVGALAVAPTADADVDYYFQSCDGYGQCSCIGLKLETPDPVHLHNPCPE